MFNKTRFLVLLLFLPLATTVWATSQEIDPIDQQFLNETALCQDHLVSTHAHAVEQSQLIEEEIRNFQILAEEALSLRAITIKIGQELHGKAERVSRIWLS